MIRYLARRLWFRRALADARLRRWQDQQTMAHGERVGDRHTLSYYGTPGRVWLLAEWNGRRFRRVDEFALRWVAVRVALEREADQLVG